MGNQKETRGDKLKVLLVLPTFHYADKYPEPLSLSDFSVGFAYLASALKQAGHEVIGLNPNNDPRYPSAKLMLGDKLDKALNEIKPDLIGLGGLCTDYKFLKESIEMLRNLNRAVPIVLGGGIVNHDAEFIFNDLKPDFAIVGEGEEAICKLASAIQNGKNYEAIDNLWYWSEMKAAKFTRTNYNYKAIDELPFPDYEPFGVKDMMDNYSMATRLLYRYSRPYPRPFIILASRQCPFKCSFCIHHRGPKYRARSMENIMSEIKIAYERYQFNILIILDELFAVNKQRMVDFANGILVGKESYGWDFDWTFQTHPCARLDLEALKLAKQAGCFMFSYGLESASLAVLRSMNKKTKVQQVAEVIKLAEQARIGFSANLIFGDFAETNDTWAESLSFWLEYGRSSFIFLAVLRPYPGSEIFERCLHRKLIPDKKQFYETIDQNLINMTNMPDQTLLGLLQATEYLEKSWLLVKNTPSLADGNDGGYSKIKARCPYCGEESEYRNQLPKGNQPFWIGTGCTKCHRRIKVEVKQS